MNHLAGQTSPYLLQHIHNPVDWYPWSDEALRKARAEDKPIFLSIGYSACHWCHVMAHESFEDADVAEILNREFVSIKMDREEFPDLDHLYMTATSLMTGRGGWPNSVWLMPDGRPWYAGTYFPREDQPGRMGFKSLLRQLTHLWKTQREKVNNQAGVLTKAIQDEEVIRPCEKVAGWGPDEWARHVQHHFQSRFDATHGGFGDAPKFPPHSGLLLLLDTLDWAPDGEVVTMIQSTLDAMASGGIHDQIGGGFHRYSTDERWHLPHFEKMLYDNALLLNLYAKAARRFNRPTYRRVAQGIIAWVAREMTHPEGGFFAALDADSEGEEGLYYTWTADELKTHIDSSRIESFSRTYQICTDGNYHDEATGHSTGRNIPDMIMWTGEDAIAELKDVREHLLNIRMTRIPPGLDHKIITAWNGLMISGLALAARELNDASILTMAVQARKFIDRHLVQGDRLSRCWAQTSSVQEGRLEDYAALACADLDLYEVTGKEKYRTSARRWINALAEKFRDPATDELFMSAGKGPVAELRPKDAFDQGSPSGAGLAIQAMIRLGVLEEDHALIRMAVRSAATCHHAMHRAPSMTSTLIQGLLHAGDYLRTATVGVSFQLDPGMISFGNGKTAQAQLRAQFPEGWYLNEIYHRQGGRASAVAINWKDDSLPVTVQLTTTNKTTWDVRFERKCGATILPATAKLEIHFQACTPAECLPGDRCLIDVEFTSSAGNGR